MFENIKVVLEKAQNISIVTHILPDGDAIGSALSLAQALSNLNKDVSVVLDSSALVSRAFKILSKYDYKFTIKSFLDFDESIFLASDVIFAVDCATENRLGILKKDFLFHANTISIDHHCDNTRFSKLNLINGDSAACGEIIYDLINYLAVSFDAKSAAALYVAIISDTGCFKYSSTSSKTHEIAARLIEVGIDHFGISKFLFDTTTPQFLKLSEIALRKMEILNNGNFAFVDLSYIDLEPYNVTSESISRITNIGRSLEGVEISVCLYSPKQEANKIKASIRSNDYIDVSKIASKFGGGGHTHASGFLSSYSSKKIREMLLSMIIDVT